MKSLLKIVTFAIVALSLMQVLQYFLEVYVRIPHNYAANFVTYPGFIVAMLVMMALIKKGWV
jgi:hypothetical protein